MKVLGDELSELLGPPRSNLLLPIFFVEVIPIKFDSEQSLVLITKLSHWFSWFHVQSYKSGLDLNR